jgi:hypothetical protein
MSKLLLILLSVFVLDAQALTYRQAPWHIGYLVSAKGLSEFADHFQFDQDASIQNLSWWGGHADSNMPISPENLIVKLYADDAGLPGVLLTDFQVGPITKVATGRNIFNFSESYPNEVYAEYKYSATLIKPFQAKAGIKYWLSIVDSQSSLQVAPWVWVPNYDEPMDVAVITRPGESWRGRTYPNASFEINADVTPAPEDSDLDGLKDAWEIKYFGSISDSRAVPLLDVDGDGFNNLAEQTAGTDPTDKGSRLVIVFSNFSGPDFLLTWTSVSNRVYFIDAAVDGETWVEVGTTTALDSSTWTWKDLAPPGQRKFYRVRVQ